MRILCTGSVYAQIYVQTWAYACMCAHIMHAHLCVHCASVCLYVRACVRVCVRAWVHAVFFMEHAVCTYRSMYARNGCVRTLACTNCTYINCAVECLVSASNCVIYILPLLLSYNNYDAIIVMSCCGKQHFYVLNVSLLAPPKYDHSCLHLYIELV